MDKEQIKHLLQQQNATITFTKVDGSERILNCTLQEHLIPKLESKLESDSSTKTKVENSNLLSVWDLDNSGWRSFRIDSIIELYSDGILVKF